MSITDMVDKANPITRIVDRFGGQSALARSLGIRQSVVWEWVKNGFVPSRRIPEVIEAGSRCSPPLELQPNDFFPPQDEAA